MKIVSPGFEIIGTVNGADILRHIEMCGRVCYKSEDRITDTSAEKFVAGIIKRGHEAVLEHAVITVKFIVDRGVSREIVRHRLAAYCFMYPMPGEEFRATGSSESVGTVGTPINMER